jgi:hypothetical protein
VVETGFREEYSELLDDKDMWLVGGDGWVCTVLLINIDESCNHRLQGGLPLHGWLPSPET